MFCPFSNLGSTAAVDSVSHVAVVNLGVVGVGQLHHQLEHRELSKGVGEFDDQLEHRQLHDKRQQSTGHYLHQRTKSKGTQKLERM